MYDFWDELKKNVNKAFDTYLSIWEKKELSKINYKYNVNKAPVKKETNNAGALNGLLPLLLIGGAVFLLFNK